MERSQYGRKLREVPYMFPSFVRNFSLGIKLSCKGDQPLRLLSNFDYEAANDDVKITVAKYQG